MSSQKKEHNRSRELFYNESRENAYNRQKDLRREIEIDVPELIENDDYPTEQYTEERESLMDKNNHSSASAKIMHDFQMGNLSNSIKKSLSNSKIRKSNQPLSRTTTSIQGIRDADRKVEDLYKWQERIKKKHEMQREFQEQIKDSMYDKKVYTNDFSNQIMEAKRPNDKVENLLLEKGKLKEMKVKALEKKLYGGDKVPSITDRARRIQHNENVYTRLYDLDKSRREQSREALSRNQSQVTDLKSQRSKSETKVKYLYSALQSPAKQYQNIDFFFSPTHQMSSKQKPQQQFRRENYTSPRNVVASPMNSVFSPIYKNMDESVKFKNSSIQQSIDRSRDELSARNLAGSPTGQRRVVDNSKAVPVSIYRRLTPFTKIISGPQDGNLNQGQSFKASSETQIPHSMRNQVSNNTTNTFNTEQDNNTQRQKQSPGPAQTERTPVLSNMMYFKNQERPQSLTPQNPRPNHQPQKSKQDKPVNVKKDPVDMRNMEAFWEQILQDDQEGRGRKHNNQFEDHEYNDDYHTSQYRLDFNERNKLWMDKKNKKIDNQRKQKQQQELQNCTFKPQLHSQDRGNRNYQQMLYNNFLHRMEQQSSHVPVESYGNSPSRIFKKNGFSPVQTMGDLDLFGFISSDSSPNEFGKNSRYNEDNELQKKLYNYILDAKR